MHKSRYKRNYNEWTIYYKYVDTVRDFIGKDDITYEGVLDFIDSKLDKSMKIYKDENLFMKNHHYLVTGASNDGYKIVMEFKKGSRKITRYLMKVNNRNKDEIVVVMHTYSKRKKDTEKIYNIYRTAFNLLGIKLA